MVRGEPPAGGPSVGEPSVGEPSVGEPSRGAVGRRAGVPRAREPEPVPDGDAPPSTVDVGSLHLDLARRAASLDGQPLDLTRKEFGLLEELLAAAREIHAFLVERERFLQGEAALF